MNRLLAPLFLGAASALALASTPALAQDVVITNAKVVLGDGSEPIENAAVIVEDGEVVFAGTPTPGQTFASDTVIDANGAWVTPGLFATVTTLG
ncbi:MAG: hypothetical protein RIC82_08765, partial [Parvibaculum sp.]